MSRFRDLRRPIDVRREDGFTLLEVVVAMGLFALVAAGTLPMILGAIKAGLVTKLDTGAKALAQERVEYLRSLPYHLDNSASTGLDLLDQYYPAQSTRAAAAIPANGFTTAGSGWVSEANTSFVSKTASGYRLPNEPATGAFYRVRHVPTGTDGRYTLFTTLQFLSADRTAYPASRFTSYRSVDAAGNPVLDGSDSPPTTMVGVNIIAYWSAGTLTKQYDTYTQISEGAAATGLINAQARVTALQVTGTVDASRTLKLRAGVVSQDAALSTVAGAASSATGAVADVTPDLTALGSKIGASATYTAEPDGSVGAATQAGDSLVETGETLASFGQTGHRNVGAVVTATPPSTSQACAADGSLCTQASVNANGSYNALEFRNRPVRAAGDILGLTTTANTPLVWSPPLTGSSPFLRGRGWITSSTVSGSTHSVTSGVQSVLQASPSDGGGVLRILPTSFAPQGLVQITLTSSSLICTATGASSTTPVPSYSGLLRYWRYNPATATGAYVDVSLSLLSSDPLAAVNLATTQVGVSGATPLYLGQYIQDWGSLTTGAASLAGRVANNGNSVSSNIEGLISVRTLPVRSDDLASGNTVKVGAMSCLAEDNR